MMAFLRAVVAVFRPCKHWQASVELRPHVHVGSRSDHELAASSVIDPPRGFTRLALAVTRPLRTVAPPEMAAANPLPPLLQAGAGAFGSAVSNALVFPLDVVTKRMQTQGRKGACRGLDERWQRIARSRRLQVTSAGDPQYTRCGGHRRPLQGPRRRYAVDAAVKVRSSACCVTGS
jgi:hypothetical protein